MKRQGGAEFLSSDTSARPHLLLPALDCATRSLSSEAQRELRTVLAAHAVGRAGSERAAPRAFVQVA